jgi:hypothetical protein
MGLLQAVSEIFHAPAGIAQSIHTDYHSVFWTDREPALEEQRINKKPTGKVGRGLAELGVTLILACSPLVKERIE